MMSIFASMPLATRDRAAKLLKARGCHRPPETLPLLAEMFLRWQGAIGVPEPTQPGLWEPMIRDFRAVACDLGAQSPKPWTLEQSMAVDSLLLELWELNLEIPPLQLPAWASSLREDERPLLVEWVWNHLDFHYLALTMGVLASGLVDMASKARRDRQWVNMVQEQIGMLSSFADFLSSPKGASMRIEEAFPNASGLFDALSESLTIGFDRGGLQGHLMARAGGWHTPRYPISIEEAGKRLPRPGTPLRKSGRKR